MLHSAVWAGCGPSRTVTARVEGRVTLGGQPLEGAAVTFPPVEGGRLAYGATDPRGQFDLSTFGQGDRAVRGEHVVTVYKVEAGDAVVEDGDLVGGPPARRPNFACLYPNGTPAARYGQPPHEAGRDCAARP